MVYGQRSKKILRGALTATLATYLALGAHLLAGGQLSSGILGLVLVHALANLLSIACASSGSGLSLWGITRTGFSVGASQWLFHLIFSAQHQSMTTAHTHSAAHSGHTLLLEQGLEIPSQAMIQGAPMLLLHALAALLTFGLLVYGEVIFTRLGTYADLALGLLLTAFFTVLTLPVLGFKRLEESYPDLPRLLPLGVLHSPCLLRGPPLSI